MRKSIIGGQLGASLVTDELSPKDYVKKLTPVPLLVVHGTRDEVVPISQGRYCIYFSPLRDFEIAS